MDTEKIEYIKCVLNAAIEELQKKLPREAFDFKDFYIAGGCIYSLYNKKGPKDYDIFCRNKPAMKRLLEYFKQPGAPHHINTPYVIEMGKYQFITKYIGNPVTEVGKFDFCHNMFYYNGYDIINLVPWEHLNSNKLTFNAGRPRDILNILARIPKFVKRGMEISQQEIYDIIEYGTRPTKIINERRYIIKRRDSLSGY
jgi:hypothetical protein